MFPIVANLNHFMKHHVSFANIMLNFKFLASVYHAKSVPPRKVRLWTLLVFVITSIIVSLQKVSRRSKDALLGSYDILLLLLLLLLPYYFFIFYKETTKGHETTILTNENSGKREIIDRARLHIKIHEMFS